MYQGLPWEALASIASIAQVVLKPDSPIMNWVLKLFFQGLQLKSGAVSCASGSNFMVKNLFLMFLHAEKSQQK
jgi:DNA mismatch repair ATPase MutL